MLLDDDLVARLAASGVDRRRPAGVPGLGRPDLPRPPRRGAGRRASSRSRASWRPAIPTAFSSDRPVVPGAPLDGVRAALRHDPALSAAEALHAWTAAGAAALGDDDAGRLAVGARSDLVILSGDPTAVPRDAWARGADGIRVEATVAAGRVVHGTLGEAT